MEGKNIVLTKRGESIENVAGTQQERVTVKGVVTDSKGEPIIGANVLEKVRPTVSSPTWTESLPSTHLPMPL